MKKTILAIAVPLALQSFTAWADETPEYSTEPSQSTEYTETIQEDSPIYISATTTVIPTTTNYVSLEKNARKKQVALNQINLPYIDQLGNNNGKGVIVGVADTGAQTNHPMLNGQVAMSYNVFDGTSNVTDYSGHGTFVASEIAGTLSNGALYQGVAPGAKLAIAKIFNNSGSTSSSYGNLGVDWLTKTAKAPIINLSIASGGSVMYNSISNAINQGVLFTIAAGNNGAAQSSWPARFAKEPWAKGQIIAVGSAKQSGSKWVLSTFSNRPGDVANWYVMAPGESLLSARPNSTYGYMTGTSMAAPLVAGQAALLKSLWPQLQATDMAQIIFKTAQRVCSDNVSASVCSSRTKADPLYGWGVIDIGKSLQPVNTVSVASAGGKNINVASLNLGSATGAIGSSLKAASASGAFMLAGTDEFNRQFYYDIGKTLRTQEGRTASDMLEQSDRLSHYTELKLDQNGSRLAFASQHAKNDGSTLDAISKQITERDTILGAALVQKLANGHEFASGTGGMNLYFGLAGSKMEGAATLAQNELANPYLSLVSQGTSVGYGVPITANSHLKLGVSSSSLSKQLMGQYGITDHSRTHTQAALAELTHQFKNGEIGVEVMQLNEGGAVLGTQTGSGFELSQGAKTSALTLHGAWQISEKAVVAAYFSQGYTKGFENSGDSLVTSVSKIKSQGFGMGLSYSDAFQQNDRITWSVSSPLSSRSGNMTFNLPTNVDENGNLIRDTRSVSLGNTPREIRTEANYAVPVSKNAAIHTTLLLRHNPSDIDAKNELAAAIRYTYKF